MMRLALGLSLLFRRLIPAFAFNILSLLPDEGPFLRASTSKLLSETGHEQSCGLRASLFLVSTQKACRPAKVQKNAAFYVKAA